MTLVPEGENGFKRLGGEETSGLGYRNFISHSKLRTRRYIKDNAVYIILQVES